MSMLSVACTLWDIVFLFFQVNRFNGAWIHISSGLKDKYVLSENGAQSNGSKYIQDKVLKLFKKKDKSSFINEQTIVTFWFAP